MPEKHPTIGLLTDFGSRDHYVGVMKAVMESLCRNIRVIDITHDIRSQNVPEAAYLLWAAYKFFPPGAVMVCVVDPGVGTNREIIGVKTDRHIFLAPKNGLLDLVLWEEEVTEVTSIRLEKAATRALLPRKVSPTFHGRDIFAPLAVHLSQGMRLESLGVKVRVDWIKAPFVEKKSPDANARVLHVDRFGNVITNIRIDFPGVRSRLLSLRSGKRRVQAWGENYESLAPSKVCMLVGSSGLVEIVMNQRSAASELGVEQGDPLAVEYKEP